MQLIHSSLIAGEMPACTRPSHHFNSLLPQLLEGLSPGLGWKVFRDYPEQFASPDAVECWRMLAAYLFTIGIEPQQVGLSRMRLEWLLQPRACRSAARRVH